MFILSGYGSPRWLPPTGATLITCRPTDTLHRDNDDRSRLLKFTPGRSQTNKSDWPRWVIMAEVWFRKQMRGGVGGQIWNESCLHSKRRLPSAKWLFWSLTAGQHLDTWHSINKNNKGSEHPTNPFVMSQTTFPSVLQKDKNTRKNCSKTPRWTLNIPAQWDKKEKSLKDAFIYPAFCCRHREPAVKAINRGDNSFLVRGLALSTTET